MDLSTRKSPRPSIRRGIKITPTMEYVPLKYSGYACYIPSKNFQGLYEELVDIPQKNRQWESPGRYNFLQYLYQHTTPATYYYYLYPPQKIMWRHRSTRTWRKINTTKNNLGQQQIYRQGVRDPPHWTSPMKSFQSPLNSTKHFTGKFP